MRKLSLERALLLLAFLFCVALSGVGQVKTGELRLEVKDPTGSGMQASGKLVGIGSDVDRVFETDGQGSYTFTLPYGRYRLDVSRDGFATQSTLIDVQSESPLSRTITLAIGASAYKV